MSKFFALLLLSFFSFSLNAQIKTPTSDAVQDYGKIDTADLKLTSCDFEKDANAMVLFDKADVKTDDYGITTMLRHKRIKIFNANGKDEANIKIDYVGHYFEEISELTAQTINLKDNRIEITPVDNSLIYIQKISKYHRVIVFTFPNVRPGSIIELQYKWKTIYRNYYPRWYFQADIPTRYSEFELSIPRGTFISPVLKVNQHFLKDTTENIGTKRNSWGAKQTWTLDKVHSFVTEPLTTSKNENFEHMYFKSSFASWHEVCNYLLNDDDFGKQLNCKLAKEDDIVKKANTLKGDDLKIAFIFDMVKASMKWNKTEHWFTNDGIQKAWQNKTGNTAEINLVLYHFLKQAGIDAYPMIVGTAENGGIDPDDASISRFNSAVVYVPVDTGKCYILDATAKYANYNEVPVELLNTNGLGLDPDKNRHTIFRLKCNVPAQQEIFVTADIKPDRRMVGKTQINNTGYSRSSVLALYDDLGEKKFIDYLSENKNNLKISSLKLENAKKDSVPLVENIDFDMDLISSDEQYIYFNTDLFPSFGVNPFLNKDRYSDIDFKYLSNYVVTAVYKIHLSYTAQILPKSLTLLMPDKSISFKRVIAQQDGTIAVRYIINRKRTLYKKAEYLPLYEFYKKMYEMLNEQIVLKKS